LDAFRNREKRTLTLSQKPYTESIIALHPQLKSTNVPLDPYKDYRKQGDHNLPPLHKEIGKLRFLADRTMPHLQAACSLLATGTANPAQEHVDGCKHIIRYLGSHSTEGLTFAGASDPEHELELFGMCNASYIPGYDSKSQIGYALFLNLNSGTICSRSYKATSIDRSAMDAEIRAIDATVVEILWHRAFLEELGFKQNKPTTIWTDNQSGILLSEQYKISQRSQHLVMRLNFIHQEIQNGTIRLCYIDTASNVADVLTKALPFVPFKQHADKLTTGFGNKPIQAKSRKVVKVISNKSKLKRILSSKKRIYAHSST